MSRIVFYDVTDTDYEQLHSHLSEQDHTITYIEDSLDTFNVIEDAEVLSVFVSSTVTEEVLDAMPQLRLIACRSTGFNNVDLNAAFERGISVVNVPSYGTNTVAEYTFSLLLMLTRRLQEVIKNTTNGSVDHDKLRGTDLRGKTIGVVGTGRIGLRVIQIAKALGMNVIAYDPYPNLDRAQALSYDYVSLRELVSRSNIVTVHAPYTEENHHLFDESLFDHMKDGAYFINTARGELVDTKALLEALESGTLAGAGLDVLEDEQLLDREEELLLLRADDAEKTKLEHSVEMNALQKMPNVVITKHNAFNTLEAVSRINATTVENINNFFDGGLRNAVHPDPAKGVLVIARHGESVWNAAGKWTGSTDVHLTNKGKREASLLGKALRDFEFDNIFVSKQVRSQETAAGILQELEGSDKKIVATSAINERDYGVYTGMNKWELRDEVGEEEFHAIRRGWDVEVPEGETLKMVYDRAVPYYLDSIVPLLEEGKNVLLVAHGNSIRALMKYIEMIDDEMIERTEMIFGTALIYRVLSDGTMASRQERTIETTPPPA